MVQFFCIFTSRYEHSLISGFVFNTTLFLSRDLKNIQIMHSFDENIFFVKFRNHFPVNYRKKIGEAKHVYYTRGSCTSIMFESSFGVLLVKCAVGRNCCCRGWLCTLLRCDEFG